MSYFTDEYVCDGQMNIFDFIHTDNFAPGQLLKKEHVGKMLTYDEVKHRIGKLVICAYLSDKYSFFEVVRIEDMIKRNDGYVRFVCDRGEEEKTYFSELNFNDEYVHCKMFELI